MDRWTPPRRPCVFTSHSFHCSRKSETLSPFVSTTSTHFPNTGGDTSPPAQKNQRPLFTRPQACKRNQQATDRRSDHGSRCTDDGSQSTSQGSLHFVTSCFSSSA